MHDVKNFAAILMLATATTYTGLSSATEPEADRAHFRLLEHNSVFGGALNNTKVFFARIPDPRAAICEGRAINRPEAFASKMQLAAAVEGEALVGRIAKQVDFQSEQLILIAWKGHAAQSIKARLDGRGDAQTVVFSEWDTHTDAAKLAKNHVYFYVVDKDTKWKFEKEPPLGGPFPPVIREPELPQPRPGPNQPQLNGS